MLHLAWAASGEPLASWSDRLEGQTFKSLKTRLAQQIGASRFRQRWFGEDHTEFHDEAALKMVSELNVQVVVLEFRPPADGDAEKLYGACSLNKLEELETLLKEPLHPEALKPKSLEHAVRAAVGASHWDCIALLLEAGTKTIVDLVFPRHQAALALAAREGHQEVVQLLLEAKAHTETPAMNGETALHGAAETGHHEVVRQLLTAKAHIGATMNSEATALHVAAVNGHLAVVQLLLDFGGDRDGATSSGITPLHLAAKEGHTEVARLFLESGDDKDKVTISGLTALHLAATGGHLEVMQLLLEAGADKDKGTSSNTTALHLAAQNGRLEVVLRLLQERADMNKATESGKTALQLATLKHHLEIVELLLEAGSPKDTVPP